MHVMYEEHPHWQKAGVVTSANMAATVVGGECTLTLASVRPRTGQYICRLHSGGGYKYFVHKHDGNCAVVCRPKGAFDITVVDLGLGPDACQCSVRATCVKTGAEQVVALGLQYNIYWAKRLIAEALHLPPGSEVKVMQFMDLEGRRNAYKVLYTESWKQTPSSSSKVLKKPSLSRQVLKKPAMLVLKKPSSSRHG